MSAKCPKRENKGHNWVPSGPYDTGDRFRRESIGVRGYYCNFCRTATNDNPQCAWPFVADGGRFVTSHRCFAVGRVLRAVCPWNSPEDPRCPPGTPAPDGPMWWYCKRHDPERKKQP